MTHRLVGAIASSEEWVRFDAAYASQGLDPLDLPPDRFLNAVYAHLVAGVDRHTSEGQQALRKFEARLWMPPAGVEVEEGPWSAAAETEAFQSFKKMIRPDDAVQPASGPVAAGKPTGDRAQRRPGQATAAPAAPAREPGARRRAAAAGRAPGGGRVIAPNATQARGGAR